MSSDCHSADRLAILDYIEAILDVGEEADYPDYVFWRGRGADRRAYAICSDTFAWATADAEEISPGDVPLLRECLADLQAVERDSADALHREGATRSERNDAVATAYLPSLFASRKRRLRPMRAIYEDKNAIGPRLAELFDAAGPERDDAEGKRTIKTGVS